MATAALSRVASARLRMPATCAPSVDVGVASLSHFEAWQQQHFCSPCLCPATDGGHL
eukprot:CAMPEP_0183548722 /NCGR_PEP_ID=MMETSP0371-20130417/60822_1 /TAXON_ID=268820 /ORGANISM="Peridinium aciculiferum, Strain PAER-2" /LENGTH=56 /DNA_ID=CAMNT_0025752195 /DNA_START=103 /DNA_END=269 /DNA_ORIENTATION=+